MVEEDKQADNVQKPRRATKKTTATRSTPKTATKARPKTSMKSPQVLKVAGEKPLTIDAELYLCATSHRPGPSLWFEVNIFKLSGSKGFAVQTIAYKKTENETDVFRAFMLPSLDAVMNHIENYDPIGDVQVDHPKEGVPLNHTELTLKTLTVRHRIEEARNEYRGLAGDILYELSTQAMAA